MEVTVPTIATPEQVITDFARDGYAVLSGLWSDAEVGAYCERGDVVFHHSDLWHSAARATEDPPLGVRRHLRGTFLGGRRLGPDEELEPFNKNAAR